MVSFLISIVLREDIWILEKGISYFGVFSIASGAMISSGIFILSGLAFAKAGPAVFISYFLGGGILGFFCILSVVELSTAMPKADGDYYYINKTLGHVRDNFRISGLVHPLT